MLKFVLPLLLGLAFAPCPCEQNVIGSAPFNLNEWKIYADVGSTGTEPQLYQGATLKAKQPIKGTAAQNCGFTGGTTQIAKIPALPPGVPPGGTPWNVALSFDRFVQELEASFTLSLACQWADQGVTPPGAIKGTDVLGTGGCVVTCLKKIPWQFFATAGMREDFEARANFDALETSMRGAGYTAKATILAGVIEGELGFIANRGGPKDIYIEQGGASMQVSFQCPLLMCTQAKLFQQGSFIEVASQTRSRNGLQTKLQSKLQGYVSKEVTPTKECFFSTSWMGMGLDQLIASLIHEAENPEYCVQPGVRVSLATGRQEWETNCKPFNAASIDPWQAESKYVGNRLPTGRGQHIMRTAPIQASVPTDSGSTTKCQVKLDQCLTAIGQLFDNDNDKQMRGSDGAGKATNSFKSIMDNMLVQLKECSKKPEYKKNKFLVKGQLGFALASPSSGTLLDRQAREAAAIFGTNIKGGYFPICDPTTNDLQHVPPYLPPSGSVCGLTQAFGPAIFSGILYVQKRIEDTLGGRALPTTAATKGWTDAMASAPTLTKWTNAKGNNAEGYIFKSNGQGPRSFSQPVGTGNQDEPEDLVITEIIG